MRFLVLASLLSGLVILACDSTPSAAPDPTSPRTSKTSPNALPPPAPVPEDKLPARVVELFKGLNLVGRPLLEHCVLMGEDLNAYLDMYQHELEAAAKIPLTDAQRSDIKAAYNEAATVTVRCLGGAAEDGRRLNVRLKNLARPLLPKG